MTSFSCRRRQWKDGIVGRVAHSCESTTMQDAHASMRATRRRMQPSSSGESGVLGANGNRPSTLFSNLLCVKTNKPRPLSEFLDFGKFSLPSQEKLIERLNANTTYYAVNYLIVLAVFMLFVW